MILKNTYKSMGQLLSDYHFIEWVGQKSQLAPLFIVLVVKTHVQHYQNITFNLKTKNFNSTRVIDL